MSYFVKPLLLRLDVSIALVVKERTDCFAISHLFFCVLFEGIFFSP